MADIRQLPPSVVNKIAAGEVIERPASVVKELLENSVDAGATRIDVSVEKGGLDLVRVADDGCGIAPDQLPLAVASHATSKIASADDLFDVRTLGFRGEALASIAEVSELLLRSRTRDQQAGAQLEVRGGAAGSVAPCGCPVGTVLEIRHLFFNTPVRRKFLRSVQTELAHVTEAFTRIALAHPAVHFTLKHNERVIFDLPPVDSWRGRIVTFFGAEIGEALIPVASDDGAIRLVGYVANPSYSRANNRLQYFFLNGRHIRDRSLQHALGEAYRGLLLTGRYPIAFFRWEMPADQVDVNVHPTKLEVRFQDGGRLYSQLLGTIRQKFLTTDLTARIPSAPPHAAASLRDASATPDSTPAPLLGDPDPAGAHDPAQAQRHREELVNWARGQLTGGAAPSEDARSTPPPPPPGPIRFNQPNLPVDFSVPPRPIPDFKPFPDRGGLPIHTPTGERASHLPPPSASTQPTPLPATPESPARLGPNLCHAGIQVHNRYLITENEDGVVIIDQHALHERILYEQLREKISAGTLEKQKLLVPEPVSLTPAEAAAALDAREALAELGIELEPFGGSTLLVSSYPAMLANFNPQEVLRQLAEQLLSGGKPPDRRTLLDEMLHMIACKAAIKAGDRLTTEEITALLGQRHLVQDSHHCPHGRPTALVFTREELDKRFKRT
jgi:DNA mismatch repair protein MutL